MAIILYNTDITSISETWMANLTRFGQMVFATFPPQRAFISFVGEAYYHLLLEYDTSMSNYFTSLCVGMF